MSNRGRTSPHLVNSSRWRDISLPRVTVSQVRQYEPDTRWFALPASGIHGLGHEARVLIWTQILAEMVRQEGSSIDAAVLGWAAAVHDTQRSDDGDDPDHGRRAASWLADHRSIIPPSISREQVIYLCRWHVPPDHLVPDMTMELRVFKDADALDRWRISDLNPSFLRTASAQKLLRPSYALWTETTSVCSSEQAFTRILGVAQRLGILADG